MSDSNATVLAYFLSLSLMLGYCVRIAILRRKIKKEAAVTLPPVSELPSVPRKEAVLREVKPPAKIRASSRSE